MNTFSQFGQQQRKAEISRLDAAYETDRKAFQQSHDAVMAVLEQSHEQRMQGLASSYRARLEAINVHFDYNDASYSDSSRSRADVR